MFKKFILISMLFFVTLLPVSGNTPKRIEPLKQNPTGYWGKSIKTLCKEDALLDYALWVSAIECPCLRIYLIFTSHLSKEKISCLINQHYIIDQTVHFIEEEIEQQKKYNDTNSSSLFYDENNISNTIIAHVVTAPFVMLSAFFEDNRSEKEKEKITKQTYDFLCKRRDAIIKILKKAGCLYAQNRC